MRLQMKNTVTAPKVIQIKTSRRNVFLRKRGEERILIASRRKKWLWKEFDTAWRERSKSGFRVRLTRVSHSLRKRG